LRTDTDRHGDRDRDRDRSREISETKRVLAVEQGFAL
jgi:hypothetical protein